MVDTLSLWCELTSHRHRDNLTVLALCSRVGEGEGLDGVRGDGARDGPQSNDLR